MLAIHGGYFDNNFGDLLLIKIFENWAKSVSDLPVVYPHVPEKEQGRYGKLFPNSYYGIKQNKAWKALIYAGGGHFGEPDRSSQKGYKGYRVANIRFFMRHVLPAELCIRNRIPYAIAGVGAGPLSNLFVRQEVRRMFSHAEIVSVRDVESEKFVRETLGIDRVKMIPDVALTLSKDDIPAQAMETATQVLGDYINQPLLGIHHARYILADTAPAEILRASILPALAATPDVVPVVFADDGNSKFSEPCDRLAEMIRNATGKPCLAIPFKGLWETIALISKLSAVVTTKLHVGIVAYSMNVYPESFAVHPKVLRFYRQVGRESQSILLRDIDPVVASRKMERVVYAAQQRESVQDEHWYTIRDQAFENEYLVTKFLKSALEMQQVA
jgi:polysaccharide pyruvyl transferase WcaK-like protein